MWIECRIAAVILLLQVDLAIPANTTMELRGVFGQFNSPNYPQNYPANSENIWKITVGAAQRILLGFHTNSKFEGSTPCSYDYVELRDGASETSPLIGNGRYCASSPPSGGALSTANKMWIRFHSDHLLQYSGFSAIYIAIANTSDFSQDLQQAQKEQRKIIELEQQKVQLEQQLKQRSQSTTWLGIRSNASDNNFTQYNSWYSVECYIFATNPVPSQSIRMRWKPCTASESCSWNGERSLSDDANQRSTSYLRHLSSITLQANETRTLECLALGISVSITIIATDIPHAMRNKGFLVRVRNKKDYYCEGEAIELECLTQKYLYSDVHWVKADSNGRENRVREELKVVNTNFSNQNILTIRNITWRLHEGIYKCVALFNGTSASRQLQLVKFPGKPVERDCKSSVFAILQKISVDDSNEAMEEESSVSTVDETATSHAAIGDKLAVVAFAFVGALLLLLLVVVVCFVRRVREEKHKAGTVTYYAQERPLLNANTQPAEQAEESTYYEIPISIQKQA